MNVIETANLTKHFGKTIALHDISIHVGAGEIYGFLGLNGAGKTTLIRSLLGMITPQQGRIYLLGQLLDKRFGKWNDIGYLVETPYAYPNLTVYENLKVVYHLRGLQDPADIDLVMDRLRLSRYRDIKAKALSLGNQQRLGLAKALMHRPKLLLLDEPINGLDPEGISEIRNLLLDMAASGTTIFLSSHILGEISRVASRIGIIDEGKLIREMTTGELSAQIIKKLVVRTVDNLKAIDLLRTHGYNADMDSNLHELEVMDERALAHPEHIARLLTENDMPPSQLFTYTEDLEMFFLRTIKPSSS